MLRTVVIQNFIHYTEYTRVNLQPGPNFIIGPNASGKSSFFELIRRCMSREINHSWSSLRHKEEPACILCEYDLQTHEYKYKPNEEKEKRQTDVIDTHIEVPDNARIVNDGLFEEATHTPIIGASVKEKAEKQITTPEGQFTPDVRIRQKQTDKLSEKCVVETSENISSKQPPIKMKFAKSTEYKAKWKANDNWIDRQEKATVSMSETPILTSCSDRAMQDQFQKTLNTGIFYDDVNQCFHHICQIIRSGDQSVVESYITSYWYNPKSSKDDPKSFDNYTLFHNKEMVTNNTAHKDIATCLKYLLVHNRHNSMTKEEATTHSREIIRHINTLSQKVMKTTSTQENNSPGELILRFITETYFVATFGARGLLPIHWTRSPLMRRGFRADNYKLSTDSAEILNELLSDDHVNSSVEERYFNILTHPWRYKIKRNIENGIAKITVEDGTFHMSLLKIPGGILEAKQLTLMLAHTLFQTLCLEEPDKTMHPQMVERMRDLLWQSPELQDKVILVQSHNQAMMSRWTFDRTFIFRRPQEGTVSIIKPDLKVIRDCSRDDVLQLPFASFALVTEGAGDKNFIKSMFSHLLHSEEDDTFKAFICNLHVIEMGGKGEHEKIKTVVAQIGMNQETFYVRDRDTYVPKISKDKANQSREAKRKNENQIREKIDELARNFHKDSFSEEGGEKKLRDLCISSYETNIDKIREHCSSLAFESFATIDTTLQKDNIFIWQSGNLEEMVRSTILERRDTFIGACREHAQINQHGDKDVDEYISYLQRACFLGKIKEKLKKENRENEENEQLCLNGQDIDFLSKFVLGGSEGNMFLDFLKLKWKPQSRV